MCCTRAIINATHNFTLTQIFTTFFLTFLAPHQNSNLYSPLIYESHLSCSVPQLDTKWCPIYQDLHCKQKEREGWEWVSAGNFSYLSTNISPVYIPRSSLNVRSCTVSKSSLLKSMRSSICPATPFFCCYTNEGMEPAMNSQRSLLSA